MEILNYRKIVFLGLCCLSLLEYKTSASSIAERKNRGVIDGYEDCGSMGTVYEVRVEDCDELPCLLLPGRTYVIEIDFSTSTSGEEWNVIVTGIAGNTSVEVLNEVVDAAISPGERHTLQYELPVTSLFEGLDIKVKVELIENAARVQEVCVSADAKVIEIPETTSSSPF